MIRQSTIYNNIIPINKKDQNDDFIDVQIRYKDNDETRKLLNYNKTKQMVDSLYDYNIFVVSPINDNKTPISSIDQVPAILKESNLLLNYVISPICNYDRKEIILMIMPIIESA